MATTPQDARRHVPGAPDTTKPASTAHLPQRAPTHAVQGPPAWENSRDSVSMRSGPPPLHGATARDACPPEQQ